MPLAAAIDRRPASADASGATPRTVSRVELFSDIAAVEPIWRRLEAGWTSPYQRYDLLAAWRRHSGVAEGVEPCIAIGFDREGEPSMLLPLGIAKGAVRVASFLGGKHITFNLPLVRDDAVQGIGDSDLAAVLDALRGHPARPDLLALERQPVQWRGVRNPLLRFAHQPSVNICPAAALKPGDPPASRISNSLRRRLKNKERKLNQLGPARSIVAESDADIARLLDAFFRIKPLRMAAQRLPNVFAEPGAEAFIRQACHARGPDGAPAIRIHALESDEVIAIFAGVADGRRFSMMFNTYTLSEAARYSPGLILIRDIVDHYAALNYEAFDLGIGDDEYKRLFCKQDEPLADSYIGLSPSGRAAAAVLSLASRGKRWIKQTPALKSAAIAARGLLLRRAD